MKMRSLSLAILGLLVGFQVIGASVAFPVAKPKYSLDFLFQYALEKKGFKERPEVPRPEFFFASQVPLKQFQDDVEPQWGMRPDQVLNVFVVAKNRIYILDDKNYYDSLKRCVDDSMVHEIIHFIQSAYQGFDLNDDSLEGNAVDIQTQFREDHCSGKSEK